MASTTIKINAINMSRNKLRYSKPVPFCGLETILRFAKLAFCAKSRQIGCRFGLKSPPQMDNGMFGPRFAHGYGFYRRRIAIANAHCRQSSYCRKSPLYSVLTKDNAMFGPRFLHGDRIYRRRIVVRTRVGAFEK